VTTGLDGGNERASARTGRLFPSARVVPLVAAGLPTFTDPIIDPLDPRARWNRDVFRLLVALNSQVTVDVSRFQRQVLDQDPKGKIGNIVIQFRNQMVSSGAVDAEKRFESSCWKAVGLT
jgi:hypothetical protein